ncbi:MULTISPECIES: TetR/AcrR family transcriptional regulator [unclassified Bradyrhizobium]|uniref:TetR/AcrR family transcriptional regulator n=1 Tax=unclassified Bradyrhizobium TaxID=2631580 RepID=UPI00211EBB99|nr:MULTISPECIES: TetR/AcrR family transcriptional regulator [unclassified Bradyrhizobium]MDD1533462.1 TetR family transcriptional regulator [Bradyrhizobium sp. WBOS8]MDD1582193.1 TetR family transcriptional regulator [Bradyrhizobium sp. WBOS4]UUO47234.1 TetR family transcriptional regulator [Bradyrhizobium sp. WBOS04]UUO60852.1 TetR family transcriptional regulator [Bradyrhizobium sp. WBOS08]
MVTANGGGDGADGAPRRGRPRSIETSNAILESAYALMASTGLAATTIDAVARHSGVSKMTIYKWWPSREALLIDAFLRHAAQMLPLPPVSSGSPAARARRHAAAYAEALQGEFGKVQLAVISECISKTGSAELFYARYLQFRRDALVEMIAAGQHDGSILAEGPAEDLYDAIYGSLFYRYVFGIAPITPGYARNLVDLILRPKA